MTDKIMIDGVDVSGCEFYKFKFCYCSKGVDGLEKPCYKHPNCYYKQLARKTEECEKLKDELYFTNESLKDFEEHFNKAEQQLQNEQQKNRELEAYKEVMENADWKGQWEELNKKLESTTEGFKKLEGTVDNLLKIQYQLAANCEKYRHALEEIKELIAVFENAYGSYPIMDEILEKCEVIQG